MMSIACSLRNCTSLQHYTLNQFSREAGQVFSRSFLFRHGSFSVTSSWRSSLIALFRFGQQRTEWLNVY